MAQIYFNRLDGLALPGEPIDNAGRVADADFYSRAPSVLFVSNRSAYGFSYMLLPGSDHADLDVVVRWKFLRDGTVAYGGGGPSLLFRYDPINNDYLSFETHSQSGGTTFSGFRKFVNSVTTDLLSPVTGIARPLWDTWCLRVKLVGSSFQWAVWLDKNTPPALSAAVSYDLSGAPASGVLVLRSYAPNIAYEVIDVALGTEGDPPPAAPPAKTVSGTVSDDLGAPSQRTVRAYRRHDGILLAETTSDPITGAYSLAVATEDEVEVVALDDDSGTIYNDLHYRVVPG